MTVQCYLHFWPTLSRKHDANWCLLTSKKFSAESAPLVPPEKLSMKRTQWRSRGTVVPPEVTHTIGRIRAPASTFWWSWVPLHDQQESVWLADRKCASMLEGS